MKINTFIKKKFINGFDEKSSERYIQYEGVNCKTCLAHKLVRVYYYGVEFEFNNITKFTSKCLCGVGIFYANGVVSIINKEEFDQKKDLNKQLHKKFSKINQ